jgi:hypothetical protein
MKKSFDSNVKVGQEIKRLFYCWFSRRLFSNPATNLKLLEVIFIEVLTLKTRLQLYTESTNWFTLGCELIF